ncbi:MAG: hypothetical protein P8185_21575 [Deltaproteobacteria bacterium]|jgi:hypothetical protein
MARNTLPYQRLPGKKKGFLVGYHTLWQGSDHLLQVYSRLGIEDYKRFYFNDIQAIITCKTAAGKIENFVLGVLAVLFSLLGVISGGGWSFFWAIIAGVMALILMINFFKGPTCETYLMTAVQTEKLHSLHRTKTTQSVMNLLRSLIEQRQGQIGQKTVDGQMVQSTGKHPTQTRPNSNQQIYTEPKHEKGRVHLLLFALLVFEGLIAAAGFLFSHVALTLLGSAIIMLLGICVVLALVKQHESNLKHALRTLTWAALGYVCFSFALGYIISLGLAFKHPEILRNQWELFKLFSSTTPWESPLMMTVTIIDFSGALLIGIPGLFLLKNPHQAAPRVSALPAAPAARISTPKRLY